MTSFSIVTPSLNNWSDLRRCVGSVRGQRGLIVEHLVQDGDSSDGTRDWLLDQADVRGVSVKDGGMYHALNAGFARASGDILSWLNADEQYLPGTLEAVAGAFASRPDVDFIYGDVILVSQDGEPLAARRDIPLRRAYLLNGPAYAVSCSLFFRRRLWDCGLLAFDTRYVAAGDFDLLLRLLENGCRSLRLDRYLGLFGITGHNLSTSRIMIEEIAQIRSEHGAYKHEFSRRLLLLGRYGERLLAKCYHRANVSIDFAADEIPTYRRVSRASVSPRWTF